MPTNYPVLGRRYDLTIWWGNEAPDEALSQGTSFVDFRAAVEALSDFIASNGGIAAWYDLSPYGSKGLRSPWDPRARVGARLGSGKGVDRLFQAGVVEVEERARRPWIASRLVRWPRLARWTGTYDSPSSLEVTMSVIQKVNRL